MQTGYSLIDESTGLQVCDWVQMPAHCEFRVAGEMVLRFSGAKPGDTFTGLDGKAYRLVERYEVAKPGQHYTSNGQYLRDLTDTRLTLDPQWTLNAAYARADLVQKVKANAGARIVAIAPDWKQRNMLGRSAEFLRKGEANLNAEEQAELAAIDAVWAWVKETRDHSDTLEAEIMALPDDEVEAWEPHSWPEFGA
jgi:hypothetical protein